MAAGSGRPDVRGLLLRRRHIRFRFGVWHRRCLLKTG
jgi:hypothetical protein